MELSKKHREQFIEELKDTIEKIDFLKSLIHKLKKDKNLSNIDHHETSLFLLEQKKLIIEKSLINNEVDF